MTSVRGYISFNTDDIFQAIEQAKKTLGNHSVINWVYNPNIKQYELRYFRNY